MARSLNKISIRGLLARSLYKLPVRGLLARCLCEISRFVRACAVEMHMDMSQEPYDSKNAVRDDRDYPFHACVDLPVSSSMDLGG